MTRKEALDVFKKQSPIIFNNGLYNVECLKIKYILYGVENGKTIMLLELIDKTGRSSLRAKLSDCRLKEQ